MPGFNLSIGERVFPKNNSDSKVLQQEISGPGFQLKQFTLKKFLKDKLFYENKEHIIVLDGVILNKNVLKKDNEEWHETVIRLYRAEGIHFLKKFRGSFIGLFYFKLEDKWIIFNDQLGTKPLFYNSSSNQFFLSAELRNLHHLFKSSGIKTSLNQQAAYSLLTYGYMLGENTLWTEIKKLSPGSCIVIQDRKIKIKQYYQLPKAPVNDPRSRKELIDGIDEKFRAAVRLQFDKDCEYGYKHLVALSGGLDSRMTSYVAHDMGFKNQINFTFSQTNYLDETIPKQIAEDLKHEWIFKALDNGLFLKDIDEAVEMTGGITLYYTIAHAISFCKFLNFENFGILHSGQLGDVIIGSYIRNIENMEIGQRAYSKKLQNKIEENKMMPSVEEKERALLYRRGFNGANSGLVATQYYTETTSPFYDIDFLEYCLSIPIAKRLEHSLYRDWVIEKYPGAAEYVWETTKKPVNAVIKKPKILKIGSRRIPIKSILPILLHKTGIRERYSKKKSTKSNMHPLNYWYDNDSELRNYLDTYFEQNLIYFEDGDENLKIDASNLYKTGTAIEKIMVLTLLSGLKLSKK